MPPPSRDEINRMLAILKKDATARRELAIYYRGEGTLAGASLAVRKVAQRVVTAAPDWIGIHDREALMMFVIKHGTVKTKEEKRVEIRSVRFAPSEVETITQAAKKRGEDFSSYVHRVAVLAAEEQLGI